MDPRLRGHDFSPRAMLIRGPDGSPPARGWLRGRRSVRIGSSLCL